ncbi:uncharacterized protein K452DRAFT_311237 [Aplosporella prunicola CBS 121167]|uniref:Uncharacterized protein n=1 Tax=Aplosporella prunicola CBS 121167 TaxID=1176127 RepID=A0A6A6B5R2_9PEZI|nr:uncharacterized protein K452DRAFT_311237 [Aplosporella prunicola CBS 121167]KAF2138763.1 hypothetical protein K452DRAFT_311237 [Aplosporella prunicola CBS 121167]
MHQHGSLLDLPPRHSKPNPYPKIPHQSTHPYTSPRPTASSLPTRRATPTPQPAPPRPQHTSTAAPPAQLNQSNKHIPFPSHQQPPAHCKPKAHGHQPASPGNPARLWRHEPATFDVAAHPAQRGIVVERGAPACGSAGAGAAATVLAAACVPRLYYWLASSSGEGAAAGEDTGWGKRGGEWRKGYLEQGSYL